MGWRTMWVILASALVSFGLATSAASFEVVNADETFAIAPDLVVNDVAFDPVTGRAYAVVAGRDRNFPNRLVVFDPASGAVSGSVFVGSEPDLVEVSTDGSVVWVGLDGSDAVAQVDARSLVLTRTISLRSDLDRPRFAEDLAAVPGSPESVVVTTRRGATDRHDGVVLIRDGVVGDKQTSAFIGPNVLAAVSSTRIVGYTNTSSGYTFWRFDLDDAGVSVAATSETAIRRFNTRIAVADGLVFGSNRAAIDARTGATVWEGGPGSLGTDVAVFDESVYILDGMEVSVLAAGDGLVENVITLSRSADRIEVTDDGLLAWTSATEERSSFATPTTRVSGIDTSSDRVYEFARTPDLSAIEDVAYHQESNRVFVAVSSHDENYADHVLEFDPTSGVVTRAVDLEHRPDLLKLSTDGSILWVRLSGSDELVQLDRRTMSVVATISFEGLAERFLSPEVISMAPVPGDPDAAVVSLRYYGLVLVDNGVIAPRSAPDPPPYWALTAVSATEVVAIDGSSNEQLHRFEVVADGIRVRGPALPIAVNANTLSTLGGNVYTGRGFVVDPESGDVVGRFGARDTLGSVINNEGSVLHVDPRAGTVSEYDATSFVQRGYPIRFSGGIDDVVLTEAGLVAWHRFGFEIGQVDYPTGALGGVVSDDLTGRGISDLCVDVFDAADDDFEVVATTKTNGAGSWRFDALRAGIYRIYYYECEFFEYFSAFHGGALPANPGAAELVEVVEGNWLSTLRAGLRRFFEDVPRDSYYATSTIFMWHAGITTGCGVLQYCPEESVTREQMASFMARFWRLFGSCPVSGPTFEDLPSWSFAYAEASCVAAIGVTSGTTPTTYDPNGKVTREQMAAFLSRLWRALGLTCPTGEMPFNDVSATSFARNDIVCIAELGITTGTTPTTYAPSDSVSRAQMAAFLDRLFRAALDRSDEITTSSLSVAHAGAGRGPVGAFSELYRPDALVGARR
ncbi:MAG: S-layer homology domain-containing protein [Actinomycetota bacterium]